MSGNNPKHHESLVTREVYPINVLLAAKPDENRLDPCGPQGVMMRKGWHKNVGKAGHTHFPLGKFVSHKDAITYLFFPPKLLKYLWIA